MRQELIDDSLCRVVVLGEFFEETRLHLGLENRELIESCRIGRGQYYGKLKKGKGINVAAYVRLIRFLVNNIRGQTLLRKLPEDYETRWKLRIWEIFWGRG